MIKLAILGSNRGTDMLAIIQAIHDKRIAAHIAVVVSNKPDAMILTRAKSQHIPTEFVDPGQLSRTLYDQELSNIMQKYQAELIILIGYMRILSKEFVTRWQNKMINVHPSLLPAYAGGMDKNIHQAVLASGATETGCTVHWVTETVDAGPILIQKKCVVLPTDNVETLKHRVQQLEGEALIEAIQLLSHPS